MWMSLVLTGITLQSMQKVITQLKENPDAKVSLNLEDKLNG